MARPVVNAIAERIYEEIAPVTVFDEENDWALLNFIHAWTNAMMAIEDVARDTDDGPGWSNVLDPDRAPSMFLDFLSALVGSRGYKGEPDDHKRIRINGMTGLRRGSAQAMRAAATRYLEGVDPDNPYVVFHERAGSAWRLAVRTLTTETPDEAQVLSELQSQKPAGIVMTYDAVDGPTWDLLAAAYDSWDAVAADYPTWDHVAVDLPTP
jgi:hypothetical protein